MMKSAPRFARLFAALSLVTVLSLFAGSVEAGHPSFRKFPHQSHQFRNQTFFVQPVRKQAFVVQKKVFVGQPVFVTQPVFVPVFPHHHFHHHH